MCLPGFATPTFVLKASTDARCGASHVDAASVAAALGPGASRQPDCVATDIYLLPPGEEAATCATWLRMRTSRDGRCSLIFEEFLVDGPFLITPSVRFTVSVRTLGGLLSLGYTVGATLRRSSVVFSSEGGLVTVKLDTLEGGNGGGGGGAAAGVSCAHQPQSPAAANGAAGSGGVVAPVWGPGPRHFVQIQGRLRAAVEEAAQRLRIPDLAFIPASYIQLEQAARAHALVAATAPAAAAMAAAAGSGGNGGGGSGGGGSGGSDTRHEHGGMRRTSAPPALGCDAHGNGAGAVPHSHPHPHPHLPHPHHHANGDARPAPPAQHTRSPPAAPRAATAAAAAAAAASPAAPPPSPPCAADEPPRRDGGASRHAHAAPARAASPGTPVAAAAPGGWAQSHHNDSAVRRNNRSALDASPADALDADVAADVTDSRGERDTSGWEGEWDGSGVGGFSAASHDAPRHSRLCARIDAVAAALAAVEARLRRDAEEAGWQQTTRAFPPARLAADDHLTAPPRWALAAAALAVGVVCGSALARWRG